MLKLQHFNENKMYHPGRYWQKLDDGRIQCDVCPRQCKLHDGQRGLCFVRQAKGEKIVLTTYGRSSGFCIDPIEKKPLNHFLPGTPVYRLELPDVISPVNFVKIGTSVSRVNLTDSPKPLLLK